MGGDHRVAVEEAALADLDLGLGRQGQPAAGLEQRALADPQPPLVERLQHLALDRVADVEAAARGVAVDPPAPQAAVVALIPAPLRPPQPPPLCSATPSFPEQAGSRVAHALQDPGGVPMGMFEMSEDQAAEWGQKFRELVAPHVNGEEVLPPPPSVAAGRRRARSPPRPAGGSSTPGSRSCARRKPAAAERVMLVVTPRSSTPSTRLQGPRLQDQGGGRRLGPRRP